MPACAAVIRRCSPLYVIFKSKVSSFLRNFSARFSHSGDSGYLRFFGYGGGDTSKVNQDMEQAADGGAKGFVLDNLPEVPKGAHQMKTARAFIWGSRKHTVTTMDDEETSFANWRS